MATCVIKEEQEITRNEREQLKQLLLPLFSWSYHFTQSYQKNHTLYFSSKPQWRLFLYEEKTLVGSLSMVRRKVSTPFPLWIGGVGSLGIKESHQGRGLAVCMLEQTHAFLKKQGIHLSLLFCIEEKRRLYEKAGYLQIQKPVTYFSKGKREEEPLAFFFPLLLSPEQTSTIQHEGLHIGRGSW